MLAAALTGPTAWLRLQDDPRDSEEPLSGAGESRAYGQRFLVREKKRLLVIEASAVDWIESESNYVRLHVGAESYVVRAQLGELAARLDPSLFERVHRCTIVNMRRVSSLAPAFNGDYTLFLRAGTRLKLSRTYRKAVLGRQFLNHVS